MLLHLSNCPLGPSVVLRPRIPRDRAPFEDRRIPRICVAPRVEGCLIALSGCYYNRGRWWVYEVDDVEMAAVEPHQVPDARESGELWLLTPTRFRYAGTVSIAL